MSSFRNCQMAWDNMLLPEYYEEGEPTFDFSDLTYMDIEEGSRADYESPEFRKACEKMLSSWNMCSCCGAPLPNPEDTGECLECVNWVEED